MEPINVISLGAGVQSSTMALMAALGEITPMPKCAIFSDTMAEPKAVYKWLDWLEGKLPFPVHRVKKGSLRDDSLKIMKSRKTGRLYMKRYIPCFVRHPDGKVGLMGRTCTLTYKIEPIIRHVRTLCDWKRGEKRHLVNMWIGISTDEAMRMKPSRVPFIQHEWPLIEKMMSRSDCKKWMKEHGFPEPPRSACTFCPFHSDSEWVQLQRESPDEFRAVIDYERELQSAARNQNALIGTPYLHSQCVDLESVKFENTPGHVQLDMFNNECEGLCGV